MILSFICMVIDVEKNKDVEGCSYKYLEQYDTHNIKVCTINITDLKLIAEKISSIILNDSWMRSLDPNIRLAYDYTVKETAKKLNSICQTVIDNSQIKIKEDFGEIMISMTASESLKELFDHISLPISELWKEKLSGNPGFDFHTICPTDLIHFGEAKYSSSKSPYSEAIIQADRFVTEEKHYRDIPHLKSIIEKDQPIQNLVQKKFSIVAAFSINSENSRLIIENAVKKVSEFDINTSAQNIYLVGVMC